jgi:hypothetical protein
LISLCGSVGITTLAGCSTLSDFTGEDSSGTPTSTPEENPVNFQVDFVDEAGTMQHVANAYSSENESEKVVNTYSEEEWQEFEDNDIGLWDDGDLTEHLDEMQLFVEYALGMREDLPGYDLEQVQASWDHGRHLVPEDERVENPDENPSQFDSANIRHVRNSDLPEAEKLVWAVGMSNQALDLSSSSAGAHDILLPTVEHFQKELLDGKHLNTISTGSMEPETKRDFTHLIGTLTYEDENDELNLRYFEPTLGGGTPEFMPQVMRHPSNSIYSDPQRNDAVTAFEYSKAKELAENGLIEHDNPEKHVDNNLMFNLWGYVDAAGMGSESDHPETYEQNGVSSSNPLPPNFQEIYSELGGQDGFPVTVSPSFGHSVEEEFDNYGRDVEEKFESIGRGIQNFYEEFGMMTPLGLGGTVDDPEFYKLGIDKMKEAWETDYEDLSELVQ